MSELIDILLTLNTGTRYVVTPNVDHFVRLDRHPSLLKVYGNAAYVCCDSKVLQLLVFIRYFELLKVVRGSDLTILLLNRLSQSKTKTAVVSSVDLNSLSLRFEQEIELLDPPEGILKSRSKLSRIVRWIESSDSAHVFLGIGSPQQEIVAYLVHRRKAFQGNLYCIGASIDFATDKERRAPKILQSIGLEWLFRLIQNPRRMWQRYLVQDIAIFKIIGTKEFKRWLGERKT